MAKTAPPVGDPLNDPDNNAVTVKVRRGVIGHQSVVLGLDVIQAPPYVRAFYFDKQLTVEGQVATLAVLSGLVENGNPLTVQTEKVDLSLLDFLAARETARSDAAGVAAEDAKAGYDFSQVEA